MKRIALWIRNRRLRQAREAYAYWKAKKEAVMEVCKMTGMSQYDENKYVKSAAEEAKYVERVECLLREPVP